MRKPGEVCTDSATVPRIVRVGTQALKAGSRTRLRRWLKLYNETSGCFALGEGVEEPITFFGGRTCNTLFCRLTANTPGRRTIFRTGGRAGQGHGPRLRTPRVREAACELARRLCTGLRERQVARMTRACRAAPAL